MIAGKRQFVDMTGVVVMPDRLSMPWAVSHVPNLTVTPHCWTSQQWHPRALAPHNPNSTISAPGGFFLPGLDF
jgi:hypothetical protein